MDEDYGSDLSTLDFLADMMDKYCTEYKENCYKCPKGKVLKHKYIKNKSKVICMIASQMED